MGIPPSPWGRLGRQFTGTGGVLGRVARIILTLALVVVMLLPATTAVGWANGDSKGLGFGTHDWIMVEAARLAGDPAWIDMPVALAATDDPDKIFLDKWS